MKNSLKHKQYFISKPIPILSIEEIKVNDLDLTSDIYLS